MHYLHVYYSDMTLTIIILIKQKLVFFFCLTQIELVNDKIGMVYSGMGPDFRYLNSW